MVRKKLKPKAKLFLIMGIIVLTAAITTGAITLAAAYKYRFSEAVVKDGNLKIYPNTTLEEVASQLENEGFIKNSQKMLKHASKHHFKTVEVGNYDLAKGTTYRMLLTTLVNGRQTPIRLTFNNFRTLDRLIGAVGKRTLADSAELMKVMTDDSLLKRKVFTKATAISMFIPNTYEVSWTITPEQFLERMYDEYEKFWNESRRGKAKALGFKPVEISIIASIVDSETNKEKEMTDVAGVYINRLRKGMMLQADPTVKFALQDFAIKRLLFKHLEVDSPYNTYKNTGLPPGPICMSSIAAIDATLNYKSHDYYYFCAKADFSGYHAFAKDLAGHTRNAKEYQNELNRRKIK